MRSSVLAACVVLSLGCGSSSSEPSTTGDARAADDAGADDALADVVAEAPSCDAVGDVLCELPLEGHVRDGVATGLATEAPYGSTTLREVLAKGTQPYALVWTSAYW